MTTPDRMTPTQFVADRAGQDAVTICALLGDIAVLKARIGELEGQLMKHEIKARAAGGPPRGDGQSMTDTAAKP